MEVRKTCKIRPGQRVVVGDVEISVLSAERQASKGDNFRLCLSLKRRGRPDTARTVVHRNMKQQWSVALWAWGACGKS